MKRKRPSDDLTVKAKDCYDPADYIMVHKDWYADLLWTLRSAHEELTDHGHQELPECECRIASILKRTSNPEGNAK